MQNNKEQPLMYHIYPLWRYQFLETLYHLRIKFFCDAIWSELISITKPTRFAEYSQTK